jgi:hypothetical protein
LGDKGLVLAIRNRPLEEVLDALSLKELDNPEDCANEYLIAGAELNDWFLLSFPYKSSSPDRLVETQLKTLSSAMEIIMHEYFENANFSSTSLWSHGKQIWAVSRSSPAEDLRITGNAPAILDEICDRAKAASKLKKYDVFFDVPVDLMEQITGFRYDYGLFHGNTDCHFTSINPSDYHKTRKHISTDAQGRIAVQDGKRIHLYCVPNRFCASFDGEKWLAGTVFAREDLRNNFEMIKDNEERNRLFSDAEKALGKIS